MNVVELKLGLAAVLGLGGLTTAAASPFPWAELVGSGASVVAVVYVVRLFLEHLKQARQDFAAMRQQDREFLEELIQRSQGGADQ